jgi:hypothetical protein
MILVSLVMAGVVKSKIRTGSDILACRAFLAGIWRDTDLER